MVDKKEDYTPIPHKSLDRTTLNISIKDRERTRYQNLKADAFVETKPHKENMLTFRAQEAGIDPFQHELYKQTPGSPFPRKHIGITSRLPGRAVGIRAARLFGAFNSPHGDYVKVIPQRAIATDPALAMTHLQNYYLRQDPFFQRKLAELAMSIETNGAGVTKQFWNFSQSVFDVTRAPKVVRSAKTGKLEIIRNLEKKTQILVDRPEIEVIDPLFFALPRGSKYINRPGGAGLCFHLELFYNYELADMEKRGFIKGFKEMVRKDQPSSNAYSYESVEMMQYYDELFDDQMNKNLPPDDPYYRRWVTKIFEKATPASPVMEVWETGGEFIRKGVWRGGHDLPYEIHVTDPGTTTWIGKSTLEKIQDNVRALNWIMRYGLEKVANSAKDRLLVPESADISQADLQRLANGEGPVKYNDVIQDGIGPKDKFLHLTNPDVSQSVFTQMDFLIQQSMEDLGISIAERAGGELPSAYRSGKLANVLESQGGQVGNVAVSLVAESLGRVYNQMMTMIYRLQTQPVDVILNPNKPVIQTIDASEFEHIPDMIAYPNVVTTQLSQETINSLSNFLPLIQGQLNGPEFIKMLLQMGASPEVARRFEEVMAAPPTAAQGVPNQPQNATAGPGNPGAPQ